MTVCEEISILVQQGRAKNVRETILKALSDGVLPGDILEKGLLAGMAEVGAKFKKNEVYVPEVLITARAMNAGIDVIKPHIAGSGAKSKGKIILGTVKGDLHDIGKNIVKMLLEGKGFEVIDIGVDASPEKFIDAAVANDAKIICCSALLTTTMMVIRDIVSYAEETGRRGELKIIVGGAPVTQKFCDMVGADAYAADASSAAEVVCTMAQKAV